MILRHLMLTFIFFLFTICWNQLGQAETKEFYQQVCHLVFRIWLCIFNQYWIFTCVPFSHQTFPSITIITLSFYFPGDTIEVDMWELVRYTAGTFIILFALITTCRLPYSTWTGPEQLDHLNQPVKPRDLVNLFISQIWFLYPFHLSNIY